MDCYRCNGLMVRHFIVDLLAEYHGGRALRCVSCGDILDPVILGNNGRHMHSRHSEKPVVARRELVAA